MCDDKLSIVTAAFRGELNNQRESVRRVTNFSSFVRQRANVRFCREPPFDWENRTGRCAPIRGRALARSPIPEAAGRSCSLWLT